MGSELNEDDELKTLSNFPTSSSLTNNVHAHAHAHALLQSPPNSGTRTPPIFTTASVPFRWEEEPGKPRPCTALLTFPTAALELQLPPRLLHMPSSSMTSPTTVLDEGPYNAAPGIQNQSSSISKSMRFKSSSFGSSSDYDDISSSSCSRTGVLGDMVLIKNRGKGKSGFFSSWPAGKKSNSHGQKVEDDDDVDLSFFKEDEIVKMGGRNGSFITHPKTSPLSFLRSQQWLAEALAKISSTSMKTTLCEGIKQVISLKTSSRCRTQVKKKKKNPNPNPNPKRFIT